MSAKDYPLGSSPYDVWLIDNHPLTQALPLDDKQIHRLVVNWYRPGAKDPSIRLTRLISVLIDGSGIIKTQDTIDRGFGHFVELSAEFGPDGTLLKSPDFQDDEYFLGLVTELNQ